jgi:tight adherence protein C
MAGFYCGHPFWLDDSLICTPTNMRKERYNSIIIDLPFFVDLLALSTQAGADFMGAIQRISDAAENSLLAKEFDKVLRDTRLGSTREQALKNMARRLDIAEVTSFVNVLTDADATGASIGDVLKEQSEQMRLERFVRAEKAGARASQAILLPMMMFIIPAVFIMVFAPVGLQFIYGGQ